MASVCRKCGKPLVKDEKPINLKLISRDVKEFYCVSCLSEKLGCDKQKIYDYIDLLRKSGCCTLFR